MIRSFCFFLCLFFLSPLSLASESNVKWSPKAYEKERQTFLAAEKALKKGKIREYRQLSQRLKKYPLLAYLEFEYLKAKSRDLSFEEVEAFQRQYPDSAMSTLLYYQWLRYQATLGRSEAFLAHYQKLDNMPVDLECQYRFLHYQSTQNQVELAEVKPLWLVDHLQPPACRRLFDVFEDSDFFNDALVLERLELVMRKRQYALAERLFAHLPENQHHYLSLWQKVRRHPEQVLQAQHLQGNDPFLKRIMLNGFIYLSQENAQKAIDFFPEFSRHLSLEEKNIGIREIALNLARQHHPEAFDWLIQVKNDWVDDNTRYWRIRSAIGLGKWEQIKAFIRDLPEEEQSKSRWQYWLAQSFQHLGDDQKAHQILNTLANERSYYGFLASHALNQSLSINHVPLPINDTHYTEVFQSPGIQRALEWFALNRNFEGKREWLSTIQSFSEENQVVAAKIATQLNMPNLAILTMAKSSYKDDVESRFPLAHAEEILKAGKGQNIDPAWIFAVARQESAFLAQAKSPVGALGLMQVMPKTAKHVSKKGKISYQSEKELLNPKTNIKIGSHYLQQLLNSHQGNLVLATAAYNAGPSRVKQWRPSTPLNADQWIETIPFSETRDYVQNVVTYVGIYRHLLGEAPNVSDVIGGTIQP